MSSLDVVPQDGGASSISTVATEYPMALTQADMPNSTKSILKPEILTPESDFPQKMLKEFITSAVFSRDYLAKPLGYPKYNISRDAEYFISSQKKTAGYRKDLMTISDRLSEFLKKEKIDPKISIDLFTDPEYSDWVETKIRIQVPRNEFRKAYSMYKNLLSHAFKGIQKRTLRKTMVVVEAR